MKNLSVPGRALVFLLIGLLVPGVVVGGDRGVGADDDPKEQMLNVLATGDIPDLNKVSAIGTEPDSILAEIINDKGVNNNLRLRAVYCLGFFQTKRARLMLRSLVTDPFWQKPFRMVAIVAYSRSVGQESYDDVRGFCLDPDRDIRLACVRGLEAMGGEQAQRFLEDMRMRESDPSVSAAIEEVIKKMSKPLYEETP